MRIFDDCSGRATYFDRDTADEMEIWQLAMALYHRFEMGLRSRPHTHALLGAETGFIPHRWQGYNKGLTMSAGLQRTAPRRLQGWMAVEGRPRPAISP
jgi:hypothetical protein